MGENVTCITLPQSLMSQLTVNIITDHWQIASHVLQTRAGNE